MRSFFVFALALAMACGPSTTDTGAVDDTPGPGSTDGGGNVADAAPYDPGVCGAQQETIELINLGDPPDVLIVLDRSGSMALPPGLIPTGGTSKWSMMESALNNLVGTWENNIRFGLSVFPTDNACGVAQGTEVDIDIDNASAIDQRLSQLGADGNTPAHPALQEALATFNGIPVNPEGRFVLFATDGTPNCNPTVDDDGSAATIAAVEALHTAGIETFVLGFGGNFAFDVNVLNDAAQAGGRAKPSKPYFYQAENATELENALTTIAGGIIKPSCSYQLSEAPPDPDLVTVTADGVPVPRSTSHTNGWDYHPDEMTITFFGDYCTNIESAVIESVEFVFGCVGPIAD